MWNLLHKSPREIIKNTFFEDFFRLARVFLITVVHLELQIISQIIKKIWSDPDVIIRRLGKMIHVKNLKQKIFLHSPFNPNYSYSTCSFNPSEDAEGQNKLLNLLWIDTQKSDVKLYLPKDLKICLNSRFSTKIK